jgi:hypothetical protein
VDECLRIGGWCWWCVLVGVLFGVCGGAYAESGIKYFAEQAAYEYAYDEGYVVLVVVGYFAKGYYKRIAEYAHHADDGEPEIEDVF